MKTFLSLFAVVALFVFSSAAGFAEDHPRDGVFIHVSHGANDPHRLLMALSMANMMADEHEVLVYLDIEAVRVVVVDSADVEFAHFPSAKTQLASLKEKGVVLMACPGCLKAIHKGEEDLVEGVEIADKSKFFSFTEGRILTLDY
jgi:predicted peroxiredoxin